MSTNAVRVYPYIWVLPVTETVLSWPIHEHHEITQFLHFLFYFTFSLYYAVTTEQSVKILIQHWMLDTLAMNCLKRVDSPNSCFPCAISICAVS